MRNVSHLLSYRPFIFHINILSHV
uniref:Uncharacterized protein n=1 Tax=Rhizophora mucronata TaxID=61149 RepID=A0A2P2J3E6_RHIMU